MCTEDRDKNILTDLSVMTADETEGTVPGVCLSTQCSGLSWLFALSMKGRVCERFCVMGTKTEAQSRVPKQETKREGERRENDCSIDYLKHCLPRLHVCKDFNTVGDLSKRGCIVVGINDQDVDSYWAALLDAI